MSTAENHIVYLAISFAITVCVARTLHKHGRPFLIDVFDGNTRLADSVNHLLVVGYYLLNIGLAAIAVKYGGTATNLQESIELLGTKVGCVLLIQGGMHSLNVIVFCKIRRRKRTEPMEVVEFLNADS